MQDSADGTDESCLCLGEISGAVCQSVIGWRCQCWDTAEVCTDATVVVVNTPSEGAEKVTNPQHLKEGNSSKVSGDNRRDTMDE